MSINFKVPRAVGQQPKHVKTRWKMTSTGKAALSYYGLKITVFQNSRGGWSIAVVQNGSAPEYYNYRNERAARSAAEYHFHILKKSEKFTQEPKLSCREDLEGVLQNGRLPSEFTGQYLEIIVWRECESDKADLFHFFEDGNLYWVPHSQFLESNQDNRGQLIIVVSRWWYERREPAA